MSESFKWLENRKTEPEQELGDMAQIWEASRLDLPEPPPTNEMWADLRTRMAEADLNAAPKIGFLSRLFGNPILAFAMVLVLSLGSWYGLRHLTRPSFAANRGIGQKLVTLDDTSTVTMHAASRLILSHDFNSENRNVYLKGEAFFEVEKGDKPFIIHAGPASIQVVGTKFNVYARDGVVRLDVTEGKVDFSTIVNGERKVERLIAGQSSVVEDGQAPKPPKPNELEGEKPLWMNDLYDVEGITLEAACKVLERRFDVKIKFDDELGSKPQGGTLILKDLELALESLCLNNGCKFRKVSDVYILEPL